MSKPYEAAKQELVETPATCPACGGATDEYSLSTLGACYKCAHEIGDC